MKTSCRATIITLSPVSEVSRMTKIISKFYCPEQKTYVTYIKCVGCDYCPQVTTEYVICNHPKAEEVPEAEKYKK